MSRVKGKTFYVIAAMLTRGDVVVLSNGLIGTVLEIQPHDWHSIDVRLQVINPDVDIEPRDVKRTWGRQQRLEVYYSFGKYSIDKSRKLGTVDV